MSKIKKPDGKPGGKPSGKPLPGGKPAEDNWLDRLLDGIGLGGGDPQKPLAGGFDKPKPKPSFDKPVGDYGDKPGSWAGGDGKGKPGSTGAPGKSKPPAGNFDKPGKYEGGFDKPLGKPGEKPSAAKNKPTALSPDLSLLPPGFLGGGASGAGGLPGLGGAPLPNIGTPTYGADLTQQQVTARDPSRSGDQSLYYSGPQRTDLRGQPQDYSSKTQPSAPFVPVAPVGGGAVVSPQDGSASYSPGDFQPFLDSLFGAMRPEPAAAPDPVPGVDYSQIQSMIDSAVGGIPAPAQVAPVDLSGIQSQLDALSGRFADFQVPTAPAAPVPVPGVDYDKIQEMISQAVPQPVAAPVPVDFSPISDRMSRIEATLQQFGQQPQQPAPNPWGNRDPQEIISQMLDERLSQLPAPAPTTSVDLSPLQNDIGALKNRLDSFRQPEVDYSRINEMVGQQVGDLRSSLPAAPPPVSFDPILDRLGQLEQQFEARPQPAVPEVDLSGVMDRIGGLEQQFQGLQPPSVDYNRISSMIGNQIGAIPEAPQVDLSGIQSQISQINNRFDSIPQAPGTDYAKIQSMIQNAVGSIPQASTADTDGSNPTAGAVDYAKLAAMLQAQPTQSSQLLFGA
jgi:hypothetical protein